MEMNTVKKAFQLAGQERQSVQMDVPQEVDVAKIQCEGEAQTCLCTNTKSPNMKTGQQELLAPSNDPVKQASWWP